jgi:ferritin
MNKFRKQENEEERTLKMNLIKLLEQRNKKYISRLLHSPRSKKEMSKKMFQSTLIKKKEAFLLLSAVAKEMMMDVDSLNHR